MQPHPRHAAFEATSAVLSAAGGEVYETAAALEARCRDRSAEELLHEVIRKVFPGRIALVSSFGTESAVLLAMTADIDRSLPVLFLDTGKLFGETRRYRDRLVARLGLTDVRELAPDGAEISRRDADGTLWRTNPDLCCFLRKVAPLERALDEFSAWITGRKRAHGGARESLPLVEVADGRIKINPLAAWRREDIDAWFAKRGLPRHPLEAEGYLSVGCMPCTARAVAAEGVRSGRWRGTAKTECGIHLPAARFGNIAEDG